MPGTARRADHTLPCGRADAISLQELSALQDAPESYEAAIALATTASASHTPQTLFREGTLHRQDRDVRRVPAEGLGLDELYAVAPPAGR